MNSLVARAHSKPACELLYELAEATNTTPRVVNELRARLDRGDRGVVDALERLCEKFGGLQRLANLAREAVRRELEESRHKIKPGMGQ